MSTRPRIRISDAIAGIALLALMVGIAWVTP